MIFDDEEKCLQLGNRVLRHYEAGFGTGCVLRLLQLSENVTYLVEDKVSGRVCADKDIFAKRKRPRAILRLCRPGYHTPEELHAEMVWMGELGERLLCQDSGRAGEAIGGPEESVMMRLSGVELRQPIRTDEGDYLCVVEDGQGQIYYGAVFTYLSGTPLEDLTFREQIFWFEKLGEVTAFLHRQAKERGHTGESGRMNDLPRFRWDYESMIGRKALWGDWRKVMLGGGSAALGMCDGEMPGRCAAVLEQADDLILHKLQDYGVTEDTYGLIHGDLRGANLLVDGDTLGIIDFDDCGYGWYMQDLAASLSFMETEEVVPKLIQAWCRGYRKRETLQQEDLFMIDTFIMMRRLQLLAWIDSRDRAASAQRYRDDFFAGTVRLAKKYIQTRS